MYPVDVRAAVSQRYAEFALISCLKEAVKIGFVSPPSSEVSISSVISPFTHLSVIEILEQLRQEEKIIALVFDQFEEIFSKKELSVLFENVRSLCAAIDGARENIIMGFAWKSDGTIPQDHPAYFMWHNHSDRRKEFVLPPFSMRDTSKVISIFSKELGNTLNPILRKHLIDHCQGYPWLLKKLCIHILNMVNSGIEQSEVLGKGLNIKELFEKDLNELNSSEISCINKIALESPADFFKVEQIYSGEVVQTLINKRLVLRKGDRLILYWDIFRDYVLTKEVPNIPITYIPQTEFRRYMASLSIINEFESLHVDELTERMGIGSKATENTIRDLIMIGNVERYGDKIIMIQKNENDAIRAVYAYLKNHIVCKNLMEENGVVFSTNEHDVNFLLRKLYPSVGHSDQTWKVYASRMCRWMEGIGLVSFKGGNYHFTDKSIDSFEAITITSMRGKLKPKRLSYFLGEAPPSRVMDLINKIKNGQQNEDQLVNLGYRNAISLLYSLGLISKNESTLTLKDSSLDQFKLASIVLDTETVKYIRIKLDRDPLLTRMDAGELIGRYLNKKWSQASIRRYGNSLLQWIQWSENPGYQLSIV